MARRAARPRRTTARTLVRRGSTLSSSLSWALLWRRWRRAWQDFFTSWLTGPALLSVGMWSLRTYKGDTIDDSEYTALYSVGMFVWGIAFLQHWKRTTARWAWRWGTFDLDKAEELRPEFEGEVRTSPVTGKPEMYFPQWRRQLQYGFSALVTMLMLLVAVAAHVCSLNFQGYIQPKHDRARWPTDDDHLFHVPFIAELGGTADCIGHASDPVMKCDLDESTDGTAECPDGCQFMEGGYFDPETWMGLVPVVTHVVVIMVLNLVYARVAGWLNDLENHKNEHSFENSLIIKRFAFEAFDAYIGPFRPQSAQCADAAGGPDQCLVPCL